MSTPPSRRRLRGFREAPVSRCGIELKALWNLAPVPDHAHATRKLITTAFIGSWLAVTVGVAFGVAEIGTIGVPVYGVFSAIVFTVFGRMWDVSVSELVDALSDSSVLISYDDGRGDTNGNQDE